MTIPNQSIVARLTWTKPSEGDAVTPSGQYPQAAHGIVASRITKCKCPCCIEIAGNLVCCD
jgi:hypothetical protein